MNRRRVMVIRQSNTEGLAKRRYNSGNGLSDIDNNVWEPGVYGWTEVQT